MCSEVADAVKMYASANFHTHHWKLCLNSQTIAYFDTIYLIYLKVYSRSLPFLLLVPVTISSYYLLSGAFLLWSHVINSFTQCLYGLHFINAHDIYFCFKIFQLKRANLSFLSYSNHLMSLDPRENLNRLKASSVKNVSKSTVF